jgi:hypothetical protein
MLTKSLNALSKKNKRAFYVSLLFLFCYFLSDHFLTPFSIGDGQRYIFQGCPDLNISGTVVSNFFRLEKFSFSNASKDILWGSINYLNLLPKKIFFFFFSFLFLILACLTYLHIKFPNERKFLISFLFGCSSLALFLSLRISAGWDEFYLNLKHSWNLVHYGIFSANVNQPIEATVDFLPFLITALINFFFGIRLENIIILISLLGSIACILGVYFLVRKYLNSVVIASFIALFFVFFPPLLNVAGTGFMASFYAALIIFSFMFLFDLNENKNTRIIGYALLSLLPLVRIEAVVFILIFQSLLFIFSFCKLKKYRLNLVFREIFVFFKITFFLLIPFCVLTIWRWYFFGDPIPTPVHYKGTLSSMLYIRLGIDQFFTIIDNFYLDKILIVCIFPFLIFMFARPAKEIAFILALLISSIPYILGGGDWFPLQWARYWIPIFVLIIPMMIVSFFKYANLKKKPINIYWLIIFAFLVPSKVHTKQENKELFWKNFYIVTISDMANSVDRWERVSRLSALGEFLNATTPKNSVIASSEIATIMYAADRDMLALLGTTNPYGAKTALQPLLNSPIIGKRRFPEVIQENYPEVIALYEPIMMTGFTRDTQLYIDVLKSNLFGAAQIDINYYFAGSPKTLENLGYRHISVAVDTYVVSYWLSHKIYDKSLERLKIMGAVEDGKLYLQYRVNTHHVKSYKTNNLCTQDTP